MHVTFWHGGRNGTVACGERFVFRFKLKILEKKHGKGKALSIFAHKIGRAAYYILKRNVKIFTIF